MSNMRTIVYSIFSQVVLSLGHLYCQNCKDGQVTKPIIVKVCYKLLYVAHSRSFDKVTSWPQLISRLLVTPACLHAASDWPHTFLNPRCFCLAYYSQETASNSSIPAFIMHLLSLQ